MMLCEYGCGNEAKYKLKNGKWCCSKSTKSCKEIIRLSSESRRGSKRTEEQKLKMSLSHIGYISPKKGLTYEQLYGKEKSRQIKNILKIKHTLTIPQIKKRYSFFSQIEEMRYNPNKPKEIQVRCKNHKCPNSKEQGGWFIPTYIQLYERIRQLEKDYGNGGNYFYCSDECKNECPLYGLISDPFQETEKIYTNSEYQQFRDFVLERDDNICQYCGEPAEHVHHERPQKLEPFYALDPDFAWSVCKKCHYEKGHKDECSTGQLASTMCS